MHGRAGNRKLSVRHRHGGRRRAGRRLTITVKALSGTQESVSSSEQKNASDNASGGSENGKNASNAAEDSEPGYIVLSATAPSCLRALGLLSCNDAAHGQSLPAARNRPQPDDCRNGRHAVHPPRDSQHLPRQRRSSRRRHAAERGRFHPPPARHTRSAAFQIPRGAV